MKTLFMETTKIPAETTVGQIQRLLGKHGAKKIMMEYDNKEISGVVFSLMINKREYAYRLPCRWKPIYNIFQGRRISNLQDADDRDRAKAKRVGWRQILRWVEAQMALVQTEMVSTQEIFLPYMLHSSGRTLYEELENQQFKMLENK